MATYDFDKITDRRGTSCLKYDFAEERGKGADVLPLWVADMDFPVAPCITEALQERVNHGIYGYTQTKKPYFDAVTNWMKKNHDWDVDASWIVKTPGVCFALATAVSAFTKEDEAVIIQNPVYYPFTNIVLEHERKLIDNTLVLDEAVGADGKKTYHYHMDLADFEMKIVENNVKLFILCNPHNPVGRVWTVEELRAVGQICKKHGVTVVSDEIHNDFVYPGFKHTVFATIDDFADFTVTCTAPSKSFNLAGLQMSNIVISNEELRKKFVTQFYRTGYDEPNVFGMIACEAAYAKGQEWLDELRAYLLGNLNFVREYLEKEIVKVHLVEPEGTYLIWLDCRELGLPAKELDDFIVNKAKLWLDGGSMFGPCGDGFQRINLACPRDTLKQALEQLKGAVDAL